MIECSKCDRRLPAEAFGTNRSRENGLSLYCKECMRSYWKKSKKPKGWERKTADMAAYMRQYRAENPDKFREYDRAKYESRMRRLHGPDWAPRVKLTDEQKKERRREIQRVLSRRKSEKAKVDPVTKQKHAARRMIQRRVARGTLVPWPCEVCGEKAEAHHPAYDRPLLVTWLCPKHHREVHAMVKTDVTATP